MRSMTVGDQYGESVELYVEHNRDALDDVPFDREMLDALIRRVDPSAGIVADAGCGPGHITHYLAGAGLGVVGHDISQEMVRRARTAYPTLSFGVADNGALPHRTGALGGIVSRYSIIHGDPLMLPLLFDHWAELLASGAPLLLAFFAAESDDEHGRQFDHAVAPAYQLYAERIAAELACAGFTEIEVHRRSYLASERPIDHATILATRGDE